MVLEPQFAALFDLSASRHRVRPKLRA